MRGNVHRRSILDTPSSGPTTLLITNQSRLVGMRIAEEFDHETFPRKQAELRDRLASISPQLEAVDRSQSELADLTIKVLELSRALSAKWLTADYAMKR